MKIGLFIFRRDLRLRDNNGLRQLAEMCDVIIPLFILTPTQASNQNKYKSTNALQFMMESLKDLDTQIRRVVSSSRLLVAWGNELDVIAKIYRKFKFQSLAVNQDYTPYAIKRDKMIARFCRSQEIEFLSCTDTLLIGDAEILSKNDTAYKVYGLFYKRALEIPVDTPSNTKLEFYELSAYHKHFLEDAIQFLESHQYLLVNPNIAVHGGRRAGLAAVKKAVKRWDPKRNDELAYDSSRLSAHLKFGTISVRELYYAFQNNDPDGSFIRKLYWRDFYYYIAIHFDGFYQRHHLVYPNMDYTGLWDNNKKHLKAWENGSTGFPVVDAAMRELNTTGFMHNRGRLIVAEFLVKDLLIDWRYGEMYFSQLLVDIDRTQNVGNWNWSSSFGLDSTPFLRTFNPWSQSIKFDPECIYIKKWVPELAELEPRDIHKWDKMCLKYPEIEYPEPIVDHKTQRAEFVKRYKLAVQKSKK